MIRLLLTVMLALSLIACGSSPVKDDSPANDLDALQQNVHREAKRTILPNGKEYCVEDAKTDGQRDDCALDLEDAVFVGNEKLERIDTLVTKAVKRLKLARNPCGKLKALFNRRECNVDSD